MSVILLSCYPTPVPPGALLASDESKDWVHGKSQVGQPLLRLSNIVPKSARMLDIICSDLEHENVHGSVHAGEVRVPRRAGRDIKVLLDPGHRVSCPNFQPQFENHLFSSQQRTRLLLAMVEGLPAPSTVNFSSLQSPSSNADFLLRRCWRLQDCSSCLTSTDPCSWCAIVC